MTFFFTFLFMILVFWRPQEWLVPWMFGIPMLNGVFWLALLALLVELDTKRITYPKRLHQPYLLLGLWFMCVFSHIPHGYFQGMLDSIEEPAKICVFTFLLYVVMDSPAKLRHVARLFVLMSVVMCIHAIMQRELGYGFAGHRPMYLHRPDGSSYTRSWFFGIFEDPNEMSQMIVASIPFTFVMFKKKNLLTTVIALGLSYFLWRGMLTGESRGALIGLAAVGFMFVVMKLPARWMTTLLPLGMLGALAACPFAGKVLDISAHERIIFWGLGNQAFIRSPINILSGLGYGMFWTVTERGRAAHNAFVNCYVELGYVGFCFWLGLIILGIIGAWRVRCALDRKSADPDERYLWRFAGSAICALVSFCGSSYFLSRTFIYPFFFLMTLAGVLPVIASRWVENGEDLDVFTSKHDAWILCTAAGFFAIAYIYVSIRLMNIGLGA